MSDLHFRKGQRRKHRFLGRPASTAPDLVVGTGDFLDEESAIEAPCRPSRRSGRASRALFVLGSHDYYGVAAREPVQVLPGAEQPQDRRRGPSSPGGDLVAKLEERGWELILNRATTVDIEGLGTVDVVGLDDPHIERDDLSVASARSMPGFRLAVVHSPDAAPALAELGYDLIVCGHTHGGQVRVPGVGALVTNYELPREMARGLHPVHGSLAARERRAGDDPYAPFRFACRPEACVLELTPADGAVRNGA